MAELTGQDLTACTRDRSQWTWLDEQGFSQMNVPIEYKFTSHEIYIDSCIQSDPTNGTYRVMCESSPAIYILLNNISG